MNQTNYNYISHTHCWNNPKNPCGISLEKHTQCCLCDMKYNNRIREEFEAYLLDNWDDRENLPVADWWLAKLDLAIKEERKRIIKNIKEKGLHLGYANNIIDIINNV
jgi:hypothetical protein